MPLTSSPTSLTGSFSSSQTTTTSSRLFEGYRSIGLVSSDVPHLVRYVDKINKLQIITAVGRSFLVFNEKLRLVETCKYFVKQSNIKFQISNNLSLSLSGVAHSSDIQVLAADSLYLFTAAKNEIFAWKFGHKWVSVFVCFLI